MVAFLRGLTRDDPGGGDERKKMSYFFSNLSWVEEGKLLRIKHKAGGGNRPASRFLSLKREKDFTCVALRCITSYLHQDVNDYL